MAQEVCVTVSAADRAHLAAIIAASIVALDRPSS
jgi:hypothetical protein